MTRLSTGRDRSTTMKLAGAADADFPDLRFTSRIEEIVSRARVISRFTLVFRPRRASGARDRTIVASLTSPGERIARRYCVARFIDGNIYIAAARTTVMLCKYTSFCDECTYAIERASRMTRSAKRFTRGAQQIFALAPVK